MHRTGGSLRVARVLGVGVIFGSLVFGLGTAATQAVDAVPDSSSPDSSSPSPAGDGPTTNTDSTTTKSSTPPATILSSPAGSVPPYGSSFPITLETDFSRPYKAISSSANSDFSLLDDLERLIRGSYKKPDGTHLSRAQASKNYVYLSISRMENSHRVGRELIHAAKDGVKVRVIHGKASQSNESRALQRALDSSSLRDSDFKICEKGRSLACLSDLHGAIMHSKILLVNHTFDRDGNPANSAIWSGSANLGGPSGERTYNNGLTIYNDKKLWYQATKMWSDMAAERDVNNDYIRYVRSNYHSYGGADLAANYGYTSSYAADGMFYSNLANVTIYATPIYATPTNGKDPVLMMLNRIKPDDQCRIRLQENRFKYRRIAVAQKLVQLADEGCKVSAVSFEDDLLVNRIAHCQQYIRICRPILDTFKTANRRIETAWAKPHDKTILVDAVLGPNRYNPEERLPDGKVQSDGKVGTPWPSEGVRVKMVQAGSAALTGSNLVVSDEITTETTDPAVYDDYLEHFKAILRSREYRNYAY